jgi:membrane dipeptidase
MRLSWRDLGTPRADRAHGKTVEIVGWPATALPTKAADYFLLTSEPNCCAGCLPANPQAVLEVFADRALEFAGRSMRLSGTLVVLEDDPVGWRYQLRGARATAGITRRKLLAASPLVCLPVLAMAQASGPTVDIHSHGGNVIQRYSQSDYQFAPLAEPMRQGGMAVICLAAVSDSPTIVLTGGRLRPSREGRPGEYYAHTQRAFTGWCANRGLASSPTRPVCAPRDPSGRRSSCRSKAAISSKECPSGSTKRAPVGSCAICSSRIIGPTSWATSRPNPPCMAG